MREKIYKRVMEGMENKHNILSEGFIDNAYYVIVEIKEQSE